MSLCCSASAAVNPDRVILDFYFSPSWSVHGGSRCLDLSESYLLGKLPLVASIEFQNCRTFIKCLLKSGLMEHHW